MMRAQKQQLRLAQEHLHFTQLLLLITQINIVLAQRREPSLFTVRQRGVLRLISSSANFLQTAANSASTACILTPMAAKSASSFSSIATRRGNARALTVFRKHNK